MDFSNGKQKEKRENKQCIHTQQSQWSLPKLWKQRWSLKFDLRTHLTWWGYTGFRAHVGLSAEVPCEKESKKRKMKQCGVGKKCFTYSTVFKCVLITSKVWGTVPGAEHKTGNRQGQVIRPSSHRRLASPLDTQFYSTMLPPLAPILSLGTRYL